MGRCGFINCKVAVELVHLKMFREDPQFEERRTFTSSGLHFILSKGNHPAAFGFSPPMYVVMSHQVRKILHSDGESIFMCVLIKGQCRWSWVPQLKGKAVLLYLSFCCCCMEKKSMPAHLATCFTMKTQTKCFLE